MPFKSEAQRKYLWANEPEIARDWTDTYGSKIQAAHGGIIGSVGGTSRQKYQGGEMVGAEIEGAEMEGAMMQSQEVIKELYDALIAQGLSPQEAMEKIKEILAASQAEEPESPMMGEEFPGQEFGRAPAAFGGIMDTYTGRRKYFGGSFLSSVLSPVKKALKKVKKLASSKLGKIALMYVAGTYLGGMPMASGAQKAWWKSPDFLQNLKSGTGITNLLTKGREGLTNVGDYFSQAFKPTVGSQTSGTLSSSQKMALQAAEKARDYDTAGAILNQAFKTTTPAVQNAGTFLGIPTKVAAGIALPSIGAGLYTAAQPPEELGGEVTDEWETGKSDFDKYLAGLDSYEGGDFRVPVQYRAAQGGRIGRQEGGLMNLGGMEKDYRNDGGFVPLGGEEKADDVPARLSKNEFVFTADAVRNAGGGDIDRGAEVMENAMKNLEAGGKVSEESQGQGAQEMFETSERLSEVI